MDQGLHRAFIIVGMLVLASWVNSCAHRPVAETLPVPVAAPSPEPSPPDATAAVAPPAPAALDNLIRDVDLNKALQRPPADPHPPPPQSTDSSSVSVVRAPVVRASRPPLATAAPPAAASPPLASAAPPAPVAPIFERRESSGLRPSEVAWNTPPTMDMGQSSQVELRVTADQQRFAELAQRVTAPGVTVTERAELSNAIIATLDATNFDISPNHPQRQPLLKGRDTVWRWVIHPKQAGRHVLNLRIESLLQHEKLVTSMSRNIEVRVVPVGMPQAAGSFLAENWDKLLTLVLVPIGGWLVGLYARGRRRAPRNPSTPTAARA